MLDYVGRYTHRIANERMLDIDGERVTFRYTDYRVAGPQKSKTMTLARWKFIRRFLMHVLPTGFHRIRYYRLLGNGHRAQKLTQCRRLLDMAVPGPATSVPAADDRDRLDLLIGGSVRRCPVCQTGHMILIEEQPRPWPFTVRVDSS